MGAVESAEHNLEDEMLESSWVVHTKQTMALHNNKRSMTQKVLACPSRSWQGLCQCCHFEWCQTMQVQKHMWKTMICLENISMTSVVASLEMARNPWSWKAKQCVEQNMQLIPSPLFVFILFSFLDGRCSCDSGLSHVRHRIARQSGQMQVALSQSRLWCQFLSQQCTTLCVFCQRN